MSEQPKRGASRAPPPAPPSPRQKAPAGTGDGSAIAIGDLARDLDITTRAIRFYESRGLIHPARRGTIRVFGPADRQRLALILRAKNLGLTLEEIGEHLAIRDAEPSTAADIAALKRRADEHIRRLTSKRADLGLALKELREIRARLAQRLAEARQRKG